MTKANLWSLGHCTWMPSCVCRKTVARANLYLALGDTPCFSGVWNSEEGRVKENWSQQCPKFKKKLTSFSKQSQLIKLDDEYWRFPNFNLLIIHMERGVRGRRDPRRRSFFWQSFYFLAILFMKDKRMWLNIDASNGEFDALPGLATDRKDHFGHPCFWG